MKQTLLIITFILAIVLVTSCGNDKSETKNKIPEKIEFLDLFQKTVLFKIREIGNIILNSYV